MNKEKALKNQGLEFREDIETEGGKIYNCLSPVCRRVPADRSKKPDFPVVPGIGYYTSNKAKSKG